MGENVLIYGKCTLKYLGVMRHYACKLPSNGTEKNNNRERITKQMWSMLTFGESGLK